MFIFKSNFSSKLSTGALVTQLINVIASNPSTYMLIPRKCDVHLHM